MASEEGGAIKWGEKEPKFTKVEFIKNEADYGPNIAAFPLRLKVVVRKRNQTASLTEKTNKTNTDQPEDKLLYSSEENQDIYRIKDVISGTSMDVDIYIDVVDFYNQTVNTLNKG